MINPKKRILLLVACVSACISSGAFADSTNCIDQDGDGWGWNGFSSCIADLQPAQTECVDTAPLNDGWGWNGVESCRVTPSELVCIDSAPVGDGWGWNGVESCSIDAETVCIDSPPTGDGWGWDGVTSCRITADIQEESACFDSPPVGDGFGWNGSETCLVSKLQRIDLPQDRPSSSVITASTSSITALRSYRNDYYAADVSGYSDVFTLNHNTGEIDLVTQGNGGSEANNHSTVDAISEDGRYILISSYATNLEGANTTGGNNIFLYDGNTKQHEIISRTPAGASASGSRGMMSADAGIVAFTSDASELVDGIQLSRDGIFVHNSQTNTTTLISDSSNNSVNLLDVSDNGRFVLHTDEEFIQVDGRQFIRTHVYVYDSVEMTNTEVFDRLSSGLNNGAISDDGQKITYESTITGSKRVLVFNRQTGSASIISNIKVTAADGATEYAYVEAIFPDISPDGKYVAFVTNDTTPQRQVFIHNLDTADVSHVTVPVDGNQVDDDSRFVEFTSDSQRLIFNSSASNLTADDGDTDQDLFIYTVSP